VKSRRARKPDWDRLYETAESQDGHFTTEQARDAGYSPQLLVKYLASGKVRRVRRGIYRLKHFPPGQHEDLVVLWLWSGRAGILSHETALMLHDLSDVLSARVHLTVPPEWRERRLRVPDGVVLHYAKVLERDRTWVGTVPVTSPARTLADCAADHISPEFVSSAVRQALARGLIGAPQAERIASRLE